MHVAEFGGFGQAAALPWRKPPVYLADVDTAAEALDYAAGGWHVSIARGAAGGCTDDPTTWGRAFLAAGYKKKADPGVPCSALGRDDIRQAWVRPAELYAAAYQAAGAGYSTAVYDALARANRAADAVYAMESAAAQSRGLPPVEPPRDPRTAAPEAAGARPRRSPYAKVASAVSLLGGFAALVAGVVAGGRRMGE